ncbi:MAG TPA: hypothetical protein VF026_10120, partial [Ktedonobacteraceae bacterium]
MAISIESLLAARLFISPKLLGNRIFFLSNLGQGGHLSLYAMNAGGSVPEPLLPARIALQNPELIGGEIFALFPKLGKILLMLDRDGDENYQPMLIPLEGGIPEPAFAPAFDGYRVRCLDSDPERNLAYFSAESRTEQMNVSFQANLATGELVKLGQHTWGSYVDGVNADHTRAILVDSYSQGDNTLYQWQVGWPDRKLLYGVPLEERTEGQEVPLNSIKNIFFTPGDRGLLFITSLFVDSYGPGYLDLANPAAMKPVEITGIQHSGMGELVELKHLHDTHYAVEYNIDGCSWLYEGTFDVASLTMRLERTLCGEGRLSNGMLEAVSYDKATDRFALSFSTATSPSQ